MSSEQSDSCGHHGANFNTCNQSEPISSPKTTASPSRHKNDLDNSSTTQHEQSKVNLRKGKWTPEEEAYARAVISNFNSGYLDAPVGTTLRAYLSEKLECPKMRLTKKFSKEESIGKKVFRPAPQHDARVAKEVKDAQARVAVLYQNWKRRIESQKEETNRKSAVEATLTSGIMMNAKNSLEVSPRKRKMTHHVTPETMALVQGTADWLDKADDILSHNLKGKRSAEETEAEMKEIKTLIDQGPNVLAAVTDVARILKDAKSKGLPTLHSCPDFRKISGASKQYLKKRKHPLIDDELVTNYDSNPINLLASLSSRAAPVPVEQAKRKGSDAHADDAKAFVSFLKSVHE